LPKLYQSLRDTKERRNSHSVKPLEDLFPLKIDDYLQVKLLKRTHAPKLFKLVDSNRDHLRQWLPFVDEYRSVAAANQFIRRNPENYDGKTRLLMGIWLGESLAGVVTYDYIDWGNRAALIGFWLGKPFEGSGIMTRTCNALIDLAFDELRLNRVEISCACENTRCRLVAERLRFKQEGVSRQSEWIYDHFVDTVSYSMLASEWKNQTV
jgi:ribosomal-protein-serine acetyltransferase